MFTHSNILTNRSSRIIILSLVLCIFVFISSACSQPKEEVNDLFSDLSTDKISSVKIKNDTDGAINLFETNASEDIEKIVSYFKNLKPTETTESPEDSPGMNYYIDFKNIDGTTKSITLDGNRFVVVEKTVMEIEFDESTEFDVVVGNIMLAHYLKDTSDARLSGTVENIAMSTGDSEDEPTETVCSINTSNKRIDISNAYVIDLTGRRDLVESGDPVVIFYRKNSDNKKTGKDKSMTAHYIADKIFITDDSNENPSQINTSED